MKNTKNIFKKILMILCTFALFVPMAFGLVACDDTSSGNNNSGQLNSGNEFTNDKRLFWSTVVAGIDYINTESDYDAKNIAVSILSIPADVDSAVNSSSKSDSEDKFKCEIKINHIANDTTTSTEVYTLYYGVTKESVVLSGLSGYEKSTTYTFKGTISVGDDIYNFSASRTIDSDGKVTSGSTIEVDKEGYGDKSLKVEGSFATGLTFKNGKDSTELAKITIGKVANTIDKVTTAGAKDHYNVTVKNSTLDATKNQLTGKCCYKESADATAVNEGDFTLNVYPQKTQSESSGS